MTAPGNPYVAHRKPEDKPGTYPKGWTPKSFAEQLATLREVYPGLDGTAALEVDDTIIPAEADGLFLVPKLTYVAAKHGISDPYGDGYPQLIVWLVNKLGGRRPLLNYRQGKLHPDNTRLMSEAVAASIRLESQSRGDCVVFGAQTGMKYTCWSDRYARWEINANPAEFPLHAWYVGNMLLTHPERLMSEGDMVITCPGDEVKLNPLISTWDGDLYYGFYRDCLRFDEIGASGHAPRFGAASGFFLR